MSWPSRLVRLRADLCRRAERMVSVSARARMGQPLPDDLAQMVLLRLLAAYSEPVLAEFDEDKLYAFAYTTLHRIVVDEARRRVPQLAPSETPAEDALVTLPAEPSDAPLQQACLQECLNELDADARAFVVLAAELESAPMAQKQLGWPPGGASNACHRGKKLLQVLQTCMRRRLGEDHA